MPNYCVFFARWPRENGTALCMKSRDRWTRVSLGTTRFLFSLLFRMSSLARNVRRCVRAHASLPKIHIKMKAPVICSIREPLLQAWAVLCGKHLRKEARCRCERSLIIILLFPTIATCTLYICMCTLNVAVPRCVTNCGF